MAQKLAAHVSLIRQGRRGLLVPDSGSSHPTYEGVQRCPPSSDQVDHDDDDDDDYCPEGYHVFGWRDYFDVYVRWRQVNRRSLLLCTTYCTLIGLYWLVCS